MADGLSVFYDMVAGDQGTGADKNIARQNAYIDTELNRLEKYKEKNFLDAD